MRKVNLAQWTRRANERIAVLERGFKSLLVTQTKLAKRVDLLENPPIPPIRGTKSAKAPKSAKKVKKS